MHHDSPWTDATKARLRCLWDEGLSTAEIGRRLNVSKNSVIGQAHRLDLAKRPCPIRYSGGPRPQRASPPRTPDLSVRLMGSASVREAVSAQDAKAETGASAPTTMQKMPPVMVTGSARVPSYRVTECCWPIGDPGAPNFRFCDVPALPGKPYCAAHARLAYVKTRSDDNREVA
jgi:GcrA cell cycle regulator